MRACNVIAPPAPTEDPKTRAICEGGWYGGVYGFLNLAKSRASRRVMLVNKICFTYIAGLLLTSKIVLTSPLPRVYEETGGGKVVPVPIAGHPGGVPGNTSAGLVPIGGTDFSPEEISRISKETGKKLESEVLAPMERWMNAFALVQNRMKKLEALRLEVDSRRRTVARLGKKVDMQRAQLPQTRARGEYDMENTIKVLQHKEAKLSACRQSYKEHEALVYHQLTNLIRDTVWLKSYLSAVLRVESEAFQVANAALGSMKAALPAAPTVSASDGGIPIDDAMLETHDAIPAARSDGQPISSGITRLKGRDLNHNGGISVAAAKESLYSTGEEAGVHMGHGAGYDRYQDAESTYSRAPMSAW